jgi:hypothetical protein
MAREAQLKRCILLWLDHELWLKYAMSKDAQELTISVRNVALRLQILHIAMLSRKTRGRVSTYRIHKPLALRSQMQYVEIQTK